MILKTVRFVVGSPECSVSHNESSSGWLSGVTAVWKCTKACGKAHSVFLSFHSLKRPGLCKASAIENMFPQIAAPTAIGVSSTQVRDRVYGSSQERPRKDNDKNGSFSS